MGFARKWINLILKCVTSVRYSVIHSGHIMGLIKKYEADRIIHGCRVANGAPSITHMFFTDDSYLFCQATPSAADSMNRLLHSFELASGQRVNATKSSIFFSPNSDGVVKNQICSTLGTPEATEGSFYLGLPNIIGRKKTIILGFLKNKIINRINSWDGKFLSRVGKKILLKTVIQSLPTYAMSVFLIPLKICNDIEKLMASLWWKTKSTSGQAKEGWWLLCSDSSPVSQVFKAKRIIGTGTATSILAHPWLPDDDNPFVSTTTSGLTHHMVNSLFHVQDKSWDDSLVRDMFNAKDANLILGIPLSFSATDDHWAWIGEKIGHYLSNQPTNCYKIRRITDMGKTTLGFGARNTLVWDKKASFPSQVVTSAWTTLDHWLKAQDKTSLLSSSMLGDACDSEGRIIDFVAKYSHGSFSAEVVEALGVKEALSWLKDKS
ncbi:hypothetical protein CsatB_008085 [Cannabis sativa]|uniref:uncharacterized protein LOC115725405 n=1 Tax=Cannabis sativa TaxID=3483 RepID=UPI0011DF3558|nr:uncharacterized protein LOC115725405 [Cannabis sativa]